jgi:hypothetical protein
MLRASCEVNGTHEGGGHGEQTGGFSQFAEKIAQVFRTIAQT